MDANLRLRCRMAHLAIKQLTILHQSRRAKVEDQLQQACQHLSVMRRFNGKLQRARQRGWHGAANRLERRLRMAVGEASQRLAEAAVTVDRSAPQVPRVSHLLAEFRQLEAEFGELSFDAKLRSVSVTTEPITLEDVYLGPFEIRLYLGELSTVNGPRPYEAFALEPNPPAGEQHVTHPHVSDDRVCEGDAAPAIRFALHSGSLCEFFLLVNAVLTTYNAGSPYVSLENWHGTRCTDCGDRIDSEDAYSCQRCGDELCSSCAGCCDRCDSYACGNCGRTCPSCDEFTCERCLTRCSGCRRQICEGCLDGELCSDCHEQLDETEDHENQPESPEETLRDEAHSPRPPAGAQAPAATTTHPAFHTPDSAHAHAAAE